MATFEPLCPVYTELTGELNFRVIRWLYKVLTVNSTVSVSSPTRPAQFCKEALSRLTSGGVASRGLNGQLSTRAVFRVRKYLGGELIFPVVKWHPEGLTENSQVWRSFSVCKYLGGELNSPVVEWLNKGLMSVSNPTVRPATSRCAAPYAICLSCFDYALLED
eukprot:1194494-Prorocentrum_minimum.AAC.4